MNKAKRSHQLDLKLEETALAGCGVFHAVLPAGGNAAAVSGGKLQIEEPAESITVYEVR